MIGLAMIFLQFNYQTDHQSSTFQKYLKYGSLVAEEFIHLKMIWIAQNEIPHNHTLLQLLVDRSLAE